MTDTAVPSKRISDLPAAAPLDGTEMVPITQGGQTVKVTLAQIAAFLGSAGRPDDSLFALFGFNS